VYKEWWFWVVVGVSAIILIDIATTDDQSATIQPPINGLGNASGATLFTF
jgi:hypothetical protein